MMEKEDNEMKVLIEEYKNANKQILNWLKIDEDDFRNNLIFLGALSAGVAYILANQKEYYFLLLAFCIPLYVIVWAQVRRGRIILHLNNYIRNTVFPRIRSYLPKRKDNFLTWQDLIPQLIIGDPFIMGLPIMGRAFIPVSLIGILFMLYEGIKSTDLTGNSFIKIENCLLNINKGMIFFSVLVLGNYIFLLVKMIKEKSWKIKKQIIK